MGNVLGIDVSHWNGRGNWTKTDQAGVRFAFIRAGSINSSSGMLYEDYLFRDHVAGAFDANIPYGLYFYFRPVFDGERQAEYFASLAREVSPKMPLVLDVETPGSSPIATAINIKKALLVLDRYGFRRIIYTRQSVWDSFVATDSLWSTLPLWAARYSSGLSSPWSDGRYKLGGGR